MAKLKFTQDDGGNDTKIATSMYSKDGEVVELDKPCDLAGQVRIDRIFQGSPRADCNAL
jgi:hypothetical protein